MRKLITGLAATLILSIGSAQAAVIDTIGGFSNGDTYISQSNSATTTTLLNGVLNASWDATIDPEETLSALSGVAPTFEHEYLFVAISDTSFVISTTSENTQNGSITDFMIEIFQVGMGSIGSAPIAPITGTQSGASLSFTMIAGEIYRIVLMGTDLGTSPDYTLQISAIPIPAAALLFGSALLGLFGFGRRKDKEGAALAA